MKFSLRIVAITALLLTCLAETAQADSRHFTYLHQADNVMPKGKFELEKWITFKGDRNPGRSVELAIKDEVEYGITDRLTTALYFNYTYNHSNGVTGVTNQDKLKFKGISSEWKYMVLSPTADPIGLMLYVEPSYGGEKKFIMEEKIVLSKNFGENWTWAFNVKGEHEWDFKGPASAESKVFELELTTGFSRKLHQYWWAGLEVRMKSEFPEYDRHEYTMLSLRPPVHFEKGRIWATLTVLPQITTNNGYDAREHDMLETRLIFGVHF